MRDLTTDRPIVCVDTETTGVHPRVDRVVQVGVAKLMPDGTVKEWATLVNPGIPIPPETTAVHGITDAMVASAPSFRLIAPGMAKGFEGCHVTGFNLSFDLMMLTEEFRRIGMPTPEWGPSVDAFKLFKRQHPRGLAEYVREYLGESHEGAHDALVDAVNTLRALRAQVARHEELPTDFAALAELLNRPADGHVDPDGKLAMRGGKVVLNFGDHAGVALEAVGADYLGWMLKKDFSTHVKSAVRAELDRRRGGADL